MRAGEIAERCGSAQTRPCSARAGSRNGRSTRRWPPKSARPITTARRAAKPTPTSRPPSPMALRGSRPNADGLRAVVAPRGAALRLLLESAARRPDAACRSRSPRDSASPPACGRSSATAIAERAANLVADRDPRPQREDAAPRQRRSRRGRRVGGAVAAGAALAPAALRVVLSARVLDRLFRRRLAAIHGGRRARRLARGRRRTARGSARDDELPVYTIIAPLYREGRVVAQLVRVARRARLSARQTRHQARRRTATTEKPRGARRPAAAGALRRHRRAAGRAAHQAARAQHGAGGGARRARHRLRRRGSARARPASRSPRRYFAADPTVDCLQARLTIDNAADSWLSEMFAIEYAVLFDIFNPGLAALESADRAWRHIQPFPRRSAEARRRLGRVERDRGRRPRHSHGAFRACASRRSIPTRSKRRRTNSATGSGSACAGRRAGCRR